MLIEETLFGTEDKVKMAIDRIKFYEQMALDMDPSGYFVAFSGGKDSQVVYDLLKRAGVKHTVNFSFTTVDPPELLRFIRDHYPEVNWIRPKKSMWKLIVENRLPPTRVARYCCKYLKEQAGRGSLVITGIRWAESNKRSNRRMTETCKTNKATTFLHPIIDWTTSDVWEYINTQIGYHCCLYDEGFKRIGCVGCPMAGIKSREKEFARWPNFEKAYKRAFSAAAASILKLGKNYAKGVRWENGEDMFRWWMEDDHSKPTDDCQLSLFSDGTFDNEE